MGLVKILELPHEISDRCLIANTLGFVTPQVAGWVNNTSRACLVTAIAALGVKTSFQALASLGWRPVAMLVAETVWIAAFVLTGLFITRQ